MNYGEFTLIIYEMSTYVDVYAVPSSDWLVCEVMAKRLDIMARIL